MYIEFEADGQLYQFRSLPFGLTNGVACFQRNIDRFIHENDLRDAYLDNVTMGGRLQEDHDHKLIAFLSTAKKANLTLNIDKCTLSTDSMNMLGFNICYGQIRPDSERLRRSLLVLLLVGTPFLAENPTAP